MTAKLNESFMVYRIAQDLGLRHFEDPLQAVILFCRTKINEFLSDYPECHSPDKLLDWAANRLGTQFHEIYSDNDLKKLVTEFVSKGEFSCATLEPEFASGTEGITIRLQHAKSYERQFISVIDCRGRRKQRRYHTKWHELGHLLILTDQTRLAFRRSHEAGVPKSAEESVVDAIAGDLSFYGPMVEPLMKGQISFEKIEAIRSALCPEASQYSAIMNISKLWPDPCVWIDSTLRFKKGEGPTAQNTFQFVPLKLPVLRAAHVNINKHARDCGITMIPNFRVPKTSIISRVFHEQLGYAEATENLNMWSSSDGTILADQFVLIKAKQIGESVHALVIPIP